MTQTPEGGATITRLPITTSLLLECLAALALALILAGARISSAGVSQHLVVLLDDSASMAAVNARRRERARSRRAPRARRARSPRRRRARHARSGAATARRCSPVRPRSPSKRGRRSTRWKPDAPHHSLALGIRLARELAGRTGRLMVDERRRAGARAARRQSKAALWVSVGEPLANVGIIAAERTHVRRTTASGTRLADARRTIRRARPPAPQRVVAGDERSRLRGSSTCRRARRR